MKKYIFLIVFAFGFFSCSTGEKTTYYLIRHAEKDRSDENNVNPSLTFKGEQRAQNWSEYFKDIKLDAVYSTKYYRTIETATPTAKTKNLNIQYYNPRNLYDSVFKAETKGKSVLIVGHSNTTPMFANAILAEKKYQSMDDDDNASLFIVTIKEDKRSSRVEKVN